MAVLYSAINNGFANRFYMAVKINLKNPCFVAVVLLFVATLSYAAEMTPELIRASYVLNMRKFVTIGEQFRKIEKICYYEKQGVPLNESVGQLMTKYISEHQSDSKITVKRFDAVRDITGCDVFYIPADQDDSIDNILLALGSSKTLTVSSVNKFIVRGGMIGFVTDDAGHIKMEASLKNAKAKDINIDAQFLEIMSRVIE